MIAVFSRQITGSLFAPEYKHTVFIINSKITIVIHLLSHLGRWKHRRRLQDYSFRGISSPPIGCDTLLTAVYPCPDFHVL